MDSYQVSKFNQRSAKQRVVQSGSNHLVRPLSGNFKTQNNMDASKAKQPSKQPNISINLNGLKFNTNSISQDGGFMINAPMSGCKADEISEEEKQIEQDLSPYSRLRSIQNLNNCQNMQSSSSINQ